MQECTPVVRGPWATTVIPMRFDHMSRALEFGGGISWYNDTHVHAKIVVRHPMTMSET